MDTLNKKKRGFFRRIRDKYRLVIYNDNTFEEVFQFRLSRLNVFSVVGFSVLFLIVGVILMIAFTPIREFIPGYPDGMMQTNILRNAIRLDSLQNEITLRNSYLENINNILSGNIPQSVEDVDQKAISTKEITFTRSRSDSLLRQQIEEEERFTLALTGNQKPSGGLSSVHFFTPLKGIVTNVFNQKKNHFGVDVVAGPNEVVKATLDGVVTMATWTLETGYVIQLQHENNLISVYKHNANLLKDVGDRVKAGDAIAIVGNSGELTTGPHLHFELWHNGIPINPESHIIF